MDEEWGDESDLQLWLLGKGHASQQPPSCILGSVRIWTGQPKPQIASSFLSIVTKPLFFKCFLKVFTILMLNSPSYLSDKLAFIIPSYVSRTKLQQICKTQGGGCWGEGSLLFSPPHQTAIIKDLSQALQCWDQRKSSFGLQPNNIKLQIISFLQL